MQIDRRRFYIQAGPFKTHSEQWDYVVELASELHSELVDLGALHGPHKPLAEAVAKFVQGDTAWD